MRICAVGECGLVHYGLGYCRKHWARVRATGSPHGKRTGHRYTTVDPARRLREGWVHVERKARV